VGIKLHLWGWLLPLLLLTFGLGARGLTANQPSHDEWRTIWHIAREDTGYAFADPVYLWNEVREDNPWHVPGYFLLLNLWSRLVGLDIAALRVLTLLAGVLAVALTYRLGIEQFSPRAGLLAAALLGASSFYIRYFYKARTYTLVALATALTLWAYFRIMHKRAAPTRLEWLALFGGAVGLLYTHYLAALLLLPLGLVHLWHAREGLTRRWWGVVAALLLAGLLFAPWGTVLLDGLELAAEEDELDQVALAPLQLVEAFAVRFSNTLPFLILLGVAAFWSARRAARPLIFIGIGLLLALLAASAFAEITSAERLRYFIGAWIPLALILGAALDVLWRWQPRFGRIGVIVLMTAWVSMGIRLERDWVWFSVAYDARLVSAHGTYTTLHERVLPGDHVVAYVPDRANWRDALTMLGYFWRDTSVNVAAVATVPPVDQEDRYLSPFEHASLEQLRLWLVSQPAASNSALPGFEAQLAALDYGVCQPPEDTPPYRVSLYARSPVCCAARPPTIRYGAVVALMGADVVAADGAVSIGTAWQFLGTPPPDTYSVTFQLFDEAGEKIGQLDDGLESLTYACKRVDIALPDDLPAGRYEVRAAVYEWRSGARLPAVSVADGMSGDLLPIGAWTQ
jgi:hypothetical protein